MDQPTRPHLTWLLGGAILLLLAAYIGAYVMMVLPAGEIRGTTFTPHYKSGGEMAEFLFYPAFLLDSQIRREHWRAIMEPDIPVEILTITFLISTSCFSGVSRAC